MTNLKQFQSLEFSKIRSFVFVCILVLGAWFLPTLTSAHEVYVLDAQTIAAGMRMASPNPFTAYIGNEFNFFFWGFVSFVTISTILCASVFRVFEKSLDPLLFSLKRFAHPLVRVTIGVCFISFGLAGKLFGTELPFEELFGTWGAVAQIAFILLGIGTLLGFHTSAIATLGIAAYIWAFATFGSYILTYTDYLGAFILLLLLGSGTYSIDRTFHLEHPQSSFRATLRKFAPFAFPILRMLFGFGIMFASVYAKFIHSQLALNVVTQYHLTNYFPFDPLFIVLGALIIEFLAGLMMFLGIEIRWTGLFLLFWLTLSLLYFQEAVWPHIILFGLGLAIFCHGYDRYSLEGRFFKRHGIEPVL